MRRARRRRARNDGGSVDRAAGAVPVADPVVVPVADPVVVPVADLVVVPVVVPVADRACGRFGVASRS